MKFAMKSRKFFSILFLLITLGSIVQPTITYALTTGPHQPEYTSYEQPGATDMVNLLTGDFTLSLPLLEVPGPEGNFSVPLTYNAGIGPEQEASWVGLGWTMNVGAITRQINQYPDDASGELQNVTNVNLVGVRGWTSSCLGLGQIGWNNVQGCYGALSIMGIVNYQWDAHHSSGGLLGVNVGNGGVGFNLAQAYMGVASIMSFGAGAAAKGAMTISSIAKQAAIGLGVGAALSTVASAATPGINPSAGYWSYNRKVEEQGFLHKDYWIWLDETRIEQMYGVSNLDKTTTMSAPNNSVVEVEYNYYENHYDYEKLAIKVNSGAVNTAMINYYDQNKNGAASDISYYIPKNTDFVYATSTSMLAPDSYSVKAPGISGSMRPYRFDVGSVSMPLAMDQYHVRLMPVPFSGYKVPFIYNGTMSSSYLYHTGTNGPTANFGLDCQITNSWSNYNDYDNATFTLTDPIFDNKVRSDVQTTPALPQANHVEWLSNSEIINNAGSFSNGFMDYFSGSSPSPYSRTQFRKFCSGAGTRFYNVISSTFISDGILAVPSSELPNFSAGQTVIVSTIVNGTQLANQYTQVTSIDQQGLHVIVPSAWLQYSGMSLTIKVTNCNGPKTLAAIGGYSITGADGLTYHFALPTYDYFYSTWIGDKTNPSNIYAIVNRKDPFANTWLLTGVTGPDFVDRNSNGVIDENDWGYWVKFNYGKHSDFYQWAIPFSSDPANPSSLPDPDNTSLTYSKGTKQLYYLNSIETRTHVAIFIKDTRSDNMDATSTATLRLSEIALLTRNDYKSLFSTPYNQPNDSGTITSLWLSNTIYNVNPTVGTFIGQHALKHIKFTHTYDLCHNAPNSSAATKGKLTLTRLSIQGSNNVPVIPDYKFTYGNSNPDYNPNKWDGWGLYNSYGTATYDTHAASTNEADGMAWSLSQITTPLGSTVSVNYERDKYSQISGIGINPPPVSFTGSMTALPYSGNNTLTVTGTGSYHLGDPINLNGTVSFNCPNTGAVSAPFSGTYSITSMSGNVFTVSPNYGAYSGCSISNSVPITYSGTIQNIRPFIYGGGVRVGSIVLNDQGVSYKTRYLYSNDDGTSSGVVAQEAPYTKTNNFDFNAIPGYPSTPLLYSKVSILTGNLSNDQDFNSRQVYEFEIPNKNLIIKNSDSIQDNSYKGDFSHLLSVKREISNYTSKIGALKSIKTFDGSGNLVSTTSMNYTNLPTNTGGTTNYQGCYSEGTLMLDDVIYPVGYSGSTPTVWEAMYKMTRSTQIWYPYTLQSVVTTKDGFTTEADNVNWDFVSGQVIEKNTTSALGIKTKTIIQPAYNYLSPSTNTKPYLTMGPKALDPINNKNMLSQSAAEYVYRLDPTGNITGLISGKAITWKKDWNNYRYLGYVNSIPTYLEDGNEPGPNPGMWRNNKTYVYTGKVTDLQSDGSVKLSTFNTFDFYAAANNGWLQTNEMIRYDHYSLPIEVKDMVTGVSSSTKTDYSNQLILASASNSNYYEFAYSGAEDGTSASVFFGGEVALNSNSNTVQTTVVSGNAGTSCHTGRNAVQVTVGNKSFIYKPVALTSGRTYRAMVWANSTNGAIYYVANGTENTPMQVSVSQVGNWYRIVADGIPSNATEIGVKSTSGNISFDDFRFQPRDGGLQANIYDASTGYLTYTLGNDNLYTRYQYDNSGIVIKTFVESIKYNGERLVSERKNDFKRFHTNQ